MFVRSLLALAGVALHLVAAKDESKIAVFGSSVARGCCQGGGDSPVSYANQMTDYQRDYEGREVINVAVGGDTTEKLLARYDDMNSTDAAYCFIGLSLGNEGIRGIRKEEVYNQYSTNMRQLIDMMTADGIQVILGGNYANDYYDAVEYAYIRRINIETDQWEVPNVNFNGASEDLTGKWAPGFVNDPLHPNNEGHTEMYYSIVPTVYEALKQGRPKGARQDGSDFFPIERFIGDGDRYPFRFRIDQTPPPRETNDKVATKMCYECEQPDECGCGFCGSYGGCSWSCELGSGGEPCEKMACDSCEAQGFLPDQCGCGVCGSFGECSFSCTVSTDRPSCTMAPKPDIKTMHSFTHHFGIRTEAVNGVVHVVETEQGPIIMSLSDKGELVYASPDNAVVMGTSAINDGEWHDITVAHYWALQRTLLFVDGKLVRELDGERFSPLEFVLGGRASTGGVSPLGVVDYQDWMVWRSALNADEVEYMYSERAVFHASLELYAPLSLSDPYANLAQSMSEFVVFNRPEPKL